MESASTASLPKARGDRLLHNVADYRQLGIVAGYWSLLFSMYFVPECRNLVFLAAACWLSFLNSVVIHNHLHKGIFKSKSVNRAFRCVLSFGALYPASANIASHNLVHHHFDDDGQPDWAAPGNVGFRWHLLNLIHFPNVVGPNTFNGVSRWARTTRQKDFRSQYMLEQVFAFGLTGVLLIFDFWPALLFVVIPQLWGARGILRINLIQHDGCDVSSEWNHSRNFIGRGFNWVMCNNGYHTIHHNRAGVHWSVLDVLHRREVVPRIDPSLEERSMVLYLVRTFVLNFRRKDDRDVAARERRADKIEIAPRAARRAEAEADALAS
jgi:fatty acid desaturase